MAATYRTRMKYRGDCIECSEAWDDEPETMKLAERHHRATGHQVHVEAMRTYVWEPTRCDPARDIHSRPHVGCPLR